MSKKAKKHQQYPPESNRDQDQWIMFLPESCAEEKEDSKTSLCKLRHPKTDKSSSFLFSADNTKIFEVLQFNEKFRSWFIGECIQSDGSIYLPTPVDPCFMVIPYLIKSAKSGKFMQLEQIIEDEDFPECNRLCSCPGLKHLDQICETKGSDDIVVYRYSEEKTLKWLKAKVSRLEGVLREKKIQTSTTGSCSSSFVKSIKSTNDNPEETLHFAHGMISEYLPTALSQTLKEYLGVKDIVHEKPEIEEPKAKRSRKSEGPDEDYSKQNGTNKKTEKMTRTTLAQKQLNKVDKSGMKSISSFFSPKGKK